jgi:hypothetical protein
MAKDEAQHAYALVSLYIALYKTKYNKQPIVNRYREKWAMKDVIDSITFDRARELLEYYFRCNKPGHPLNWFFYNFDKLDEMMLKSEQDTRRRELLRQNTKALVEQEFNEQ